MPNYQQLLDDQGDHVVQLDPWFKGKTRFGIAVPSYMDITAIPELNDTDADQFLGIEPSAVIMQRIPEEVVLTYGLKKKRRGEHRRHALRGRQPLQQSGGLRLHRVVATLDE
jgi:ABC-type proline/glycine betaine transport system substrate-binding protein